MAYGIAQPVGTWHGAGSRPPLTTRLFDRAIRFAVSGSLSNKEMLSPADIAQRDASPGPSLKSRIIGQAMNLSGGQTFGSFSAGCGAAYQFGPAAGFITGVMTYGLCATVSAFRDYGFRLQTGKERPESTNLG